jgi:putative ABC transport system ATP-binding protein
MSFIRFESVAVTYRRGGSDADAVNVLAGVSLTIERGEFVVLLGPSGSGKTTLLHLVSTLLRPDSGRIFVGDQDLTALTPRAAARWRAETVGYVFQQSNLVPTLTAFENVELPLFLFDLDDAERARRVELALELVGLTDRADHLPRQLSGGQEQRVAVARAIVADPPLLLADEPTGNLDSDSAQAILDLLRRLNQERGKTLLMVTHDPRAAEYGTRQVRLEKGRLVAHGAAR